MTTEPRREELLDLALGLLEPEQARALEAHAEGCAACRAELAALRQTRQLVAGLPPLPAPERGAAVLLAAARQAAEAAAEARRPRWALPRWLVGGALGLAGATALLLLVLRGPAVPTRGPLSEDREALLGQAAPAAAPAASPAAPAVTGATGATGATAAAPAAPAVIAAEVATVEEKAAREAVSAMADRPAAPLAPRRGAGAPAEKRAAAPAESRAATPAESRAATPAESRTAMPAESRAATPAAPAEERAASDDAREAFSAMARDRGSEEAAPCRLERRRQLIRDAGGRLLLRVREGRYPADGGEVALRVEERFGTDGRLLGATVRAGDRLYTVSDSDVAAGRLEPLPGLLLAPNAEAAEQTPPRCEP